MRPLGLRRRLLLVVVVVFTIAVAGLVAGFNLLLDRNLTNSADNLVRGRATAELSLIRPRHGKLVVADAPDDVAPDSATWVFSRGRTLEAPGTGATIAEAARRLAPGPERFATVGRTRLFQTPIVFHGTRLGAVVAAVSLSPYDQTRETALIGSLIFGGILLLVVALAARWLVGSSLRPVARMTRQAAVWGEHDLSGRFGLGEPHDELTELAATLDGLLDRLAASLRREQRFSAELSHELRTPLSRVIAESEVALRRERTTQEYRASLELVQANAQQLSRIVDALVSAARHEAGGARGTADAETAAAGAIDACAPLADERRIEEVQLIAAHFASFRSVSSWMAIMRLVAWRTRYRWPSRLLNWPMTARNEEPRRGPSASSARSPRIALSRTSTRPPPIIARPRLSPTNSACARSWPIANSAWAGYMARPASGNRLVLR